MRVLPAYACLAALLLSACAGQPAERSAPRERSCFDCGKVMAIQPRGAGSRSAMADPFPDAGSNDIAAPAGLGAGPLGGGVARAPALASRPQPQPVSPSSHRGLPLYDVTIRMEMGGLRTLTVDDPGTLREGDRVRVVGNQILSP